MRGGSGAVEEWGKITGTRDTSCAALCGTHGCLPSSSGVLWNPASFTLLFPTPIPCCWIEFISTSNSKICFAVCDHLPTTASGDRWLVVQLPPMRPLACIAGTVLYLPFVPLSGRTECKYEGVGRDAGGFATAPVPLPLLTHKPARFQFPVPSRVPANPGYAKACTHLPGW